MKAAVILSGCGHLDGAEIRESVLALLSLDRRGIETTCFAPDIPQTSTINHLTGESSKEMRNVREEAARIARGQVKPLAEIQAGAFDMLVIPGGFGVAKNLSDFASKGAECVVIPDFVKALRDFLLQEKPIGAICIAPAVLVAAVGKAYRPTVTIGEDRGVAGVITAMGGTHKICATEDIAVDEKNRIVTCSAYMRNDSLSKIAEGIDRLVARLAEMACPAKKGSSHAAA